ncbi:MAG: hypothetical protein IPO40_17530 [Fibrobacteres bacterium]|nr:hypothetical protein [Fibrobacterota bacterium]
MKRSIPSLSCIAFGALLFLASCDSTSTQDVVDPGAGKSSDGSLPISLVGTWLRIDSNYVVSSAGDTTYDGTDDGYLNHDTVYAFFAADGRYAGIEILWSKEERSAGYQQHTVDTISGNWSVSGGVLTRTYLKHGVWETGVHAFTTGGTSLVLVSGKSGRKFSFKRISETANLPVAGKSPGTEPSSTTTGVGLTFSPASGAYTSAQSVTIKGSVPGSSI